ncbi:MAG: hypothetical protein IKZ07_00210 [Akkermansia sp.]|nr:hypothetical protein [Akkermansia sp.]
MLKNFLTMMLMLGSALLPLLGAAEYQTALAKATERKPLVLFCYGANYDKVSADLRERFVRKREIMRYARGAVFLEVPIYQLPNEKEQREYKKVMGDAGLPGGIWSYPCLAVVDGKGTLRGIVQGAEQMKDAETAGAYLERIIDDYVEQEKLLKKARSAKGKRQITFLAEAADMKDVRMPGNPLGEGVSTGLGSLATNATGMLEVGQKMQTMSLEAAHKYVRALVADGFYSRRQRQEIMAAYAGHVRRSGGSAARMRAIYTEMRNIDPTSIYGAYAEGAIERWVLPKEKAEAAKPASASTSTGGGSGKNTAMGSTEKN